MRFAGELALFLPWSILIGYAVTRKYLDKIPERRYGGIAIGFSERVELAREYIQGDLSYRQLAEKYGLTKGQVNWIGSSYGWHVAREARREKAMAEAMDSLGNVNHSQSG